MVRSMKLFFSTSLTARSRTARASSALVLSGCLFASACGKDNDETIYSSGLDEDKPASTLSDDDKRQFCSGLDNHVDVTVGFQEISRILCLPAALLSGSRAGCEQLLDSCSRNSANPITVQVRQSHEQVCYDSLSSCEASVSTLEACVNVNVSAVRSVLESITCARFGDQDAIQRTSAVMDTAAGCASSSRACDAATDIILL
jgi:hypothetical protein